MTGSPESALDSLNISWRFLIVNGDAPREEKDVDFEIATKHATMMVAHAMIKKRPPERVRLCNAKLDFSSSFFSSRDDTNNKGCLCGSSSPVVVPLVVVVIITRQMIVSDDD